MAIGYPAHTHAHSAVTDRMVSGVVVAAGLHELAEAWPAACLQRPNTILSYKHRCSHVRLPLVITLMDFGSCNCRGEALLLPLLLYYVLR
jgi:hypothetical protein